MASDDFSSVTVAFNAASYPKGAAMEVTVAGQNKHTSDGATTHQPGTATVTVQAASGATTSFTAETDIVTTTPGAVTAEDVTITAVTDTDGRVYTPKPGTNAHTWTATA